MHGVWGCWGLQSSKHHLSHLQVIRCVQAHKGEDLVHGARGVRKVLVAA